MGKEDFDIFWPGTTIVKSRNNGFTLGLRTSDSDWERIAASSAARAAGTAFVERKRKEGVDPGTFHGISRKSDESIRRRHRRTRPLEVPKPLSKTARMREALKSGPMLGPDLGELVGLAAGSVRKMLKYDIEQGHVTAMRIHSRLSRYSLAEAA